MLKFTPVFATCNIPGYTTIHNDQTAYIDYTGEERDYPTSGLAVNLYYEMENLKNPLTIAMTRMILRGGGSVAVLCALSGNNSLQFHEGGSCALGSADSSTSVRHRSAQDPEKSQKIPHIAKKDERDDSEGKRKCGLGNSGIITLERKETVSKVCDAVHGG